MPTDRKETSLPGQCLTEKQRETARCLATGLKIASWIIAQALTVDEAVRMLEAESLRMEREGSLYPVAAPGEREYLSWENGEPAGEREYQSWQKSAPMPSEIVQRFAHVEVTDAD